MLFYVCSELQIVCSIAYFWKVHVMSHRRPLLIVLAPGCKQRTNCVHGSLDFVSVQNGSAPASGTTSVDFGFSVILR